MTFVLLNVTLKFCLLTDTTYLISLPLPTLLIPGYNNKSWPDIDFVLLVVTVYLLSDWGGGD